MYLCLQSPGSVPVSPVGEGKKRRYSDEQLYDYGRQCVRLLNRREYTEWRKTHSILDVHTIISSL